MQATRGGVVGAARDDVARSHGTADEVALGDPGGGGIGAEDDRRVEGADDGLLHERLHGPPHVVGRVIEDRLGDRHDGGDLLDVQVLVVPRGLGGLLEAGVAGHKVGGGQSREDREPGLVRGDRDALAVLEDRGTCLQVGHHRRGDLLGDKGSGVGTRHEGVVRHGDLLWSVVGQRSQPCRLVLRHARPAALRMRPDMPCWAGAGVRLPPSKDGAGFSFCGRPSTNALMAFSSGSPSSPTNRPRSR